MKSNLAKMYFNLFWAFVQEREKLKEVVSETNSEPYILSYQNIGQTISLIKKEVFPYLENSELEIFENLIERFKKTTSI